MFGFWNILLTTYLIRFKLSYEHKYDTVRRFIVFENQILIKIIN